MPDVFGQQANTVQEIVNVFRSHGDRIRGTYRARYLWSARSGSPYDAASLERPPALSGNPPGVLFPWEQVFVAAATCAGSDYAMLAAHLGIPLESVQLVLEGLFDPRGEFDGLAGYEAPPDAAPCYLALHLVATLESPAPREQLQSLHERALSRNMVLGALRGVPRTDELIIRR